MAIFYASYYGTHQCFNIIISPHSNHHNTGAIWRRHSPMLAHSRVQKCEPAVIKICTVEIKMQA